MIGQTLGHYRILEQIGAGGMGVVYRAHDERLDRDVALKVLPVGTLADEAARKRFRKEALTLSKLNHPNIETVFDFDTQDGVDFLVMELIPGITLDQKLLAGPLLEKDVLRLGQQLAEGLAAAHEQGVIHRDLKPGNLRLTPDGRLKILDFGLAKLLQPVSDLAATASITEAHTVTGTLPYMSPEQLRGEAADARSDIWAAGAVLYELATGRRPFDAKLSTALAGDIQHKPAPSPRQLKPELSPRVEDVILKCLEKESENRYQSARELAVDLRRLAAPASAAVAASVPPLKPSRGRVLAASLALVLAVAALAILDPAGLRDRLLGRNAAPQIRSIAVLPLANLSGDPQQDYFADGMTDALIAELSQIRALKVISRTSVMQYKGAKKSMPEIARELGVDGVIEGSVLREGNRVRITAQLIRARTDEHLWAENYERDLREILALQGEVARAITSEIRITLTAQEQARLGSTRSVNPGAYEVYLRARYHFNQQTQEGAKKAIDYYHLAIAKDANYALAYSGLATTYAEFADFYFPSPDALPKAREAAQKAVGLDDTLAEAHSAIAWVKVNYEWNWAGAEKEFLRALELNPNSAIIRRNYAWYLALIGQLPESAAQMNRALQLDPLSPLLTVDASVPAYFGRNYDTAIAQVQKSIAMDPNFFLPYLAQSQNYVGQGEFEKAITAARKAAQLDDSVVTRASLGYAYGRAGKKAEARKILQELQKRAARTYVAPYWIIIVYVGLGEKQRALDWLEKAYQERSALMVSIKMDPHMDPLRSDPRFQDMLRRMNFPP